MASKKGADMGLLIICQDSKCHKANGERRLLKAKAAKEIKGDVCLKCRQPLKNPKTGKMHYGIEYRNDAGKLTREHNRNWTRKDAEYRLNEIKKAKAEGGYIPQRPDTKTTFRDLAEWALSETEMADKESLDRDRRSLKHLLPYFGDNLLREITPATVEAYRRKRLGEPSGRTPDTLTAKATVNREVALLKTIFNKAIDNDKAERNPCQKVKMLKENNERDRVLSVEEYERLLAHCPAHLIPIVKLAYHTGMRQGEILNLTWGRIYLKERFIRLSNGFTKDGGAKTGEGRDVPLNDEMAEMFRVMPHGLPGVPVFTYNGKPMRCIRRGFHSACKQAGIEDFTFHDLRHTFVTNKRRAGVHDSVIMAITGHKTISMFMRYNSVNWEDMRAAMNDQEKPDVHQNVHHGSFSGDSRVRQNG
jgi:integrase